MLLHTNAQQSKPHHRRTNTNGHSLNARKWTRGQPQPYTSRKSLITGSFVQTTKQSKRRQAFITSQHVWTHRERKKRNEHKPPIRRTCGFTVKHIRSDPRVSNAHKSQQYHGLASSTQNKTSTHTHTHTSGTITVKKCQTDTEQQTFTSTSNLRAQTRQIRPSETDESGTGPVPHGSGGERSRYAPVNKSEKHPWQSENNGENESTTENRRKWKTLLDARLWETRPSKKQRASWILPPASRSNHTQNKSQK